MARHLPFDRRPHPAHPRRTGAAQIQFHRARCRRSGAALEAIAAGREHRRQALAGAHAGRTDRWLEEPRPDAFAGAGGRGRDVRQRQGRQALRQLSGAAEDSQRRRFRRSPAGEHPAVPRKPRCAAAVPEPVQVYSGRRIPGHQRRAISLAAAVVAGAVSAGGAALGDHSGSDGALRHSGAHRFSCHSGARRRREPGISSGRRLTSRFRVCAFSASRNDGERGRVARRSSQKHLLRRRRRSVDLWLARRGGRQHPALRARLSRRKSHPPRTQLPFHRSYPRRRLTSHRAQ